MILFLGTVMLMLIVMLFLVNNVLKSRAAMGLRLQKSPLFQFGKIGKNQFLVLVIAIFCLSDILFMAFNADWYQDYEPIQPTHYSHRIHAGSNELTVILPPAARVSKNRYPFLNICMNCHKNISEVSDTQLLSIQKLL